MATHGQEDRQLIAQLHPPKVVLILSGKRKSGKDYLENRFLAAFPDLIASFRIAAPIKGEFSKVHNLDYAAMLSDSPLKEEWRAKMVTWSEDVRREDPNYFLRRTILDTMGSLEHPRPIWLLTDARRPTDLEYWTDKTEFPWSAEILRIRVEASIDIRRERGFIFTAGIDDATTECGVDHINNWDFVVNNDGDDSTLVPALESIYNRIKTNL